MSKKIIILNGAARKNGNTAKLIQAFSSSAIDAGHIIKEFYLEDMNINSCKGCLKGGKDSNSPCVQKDDMDEIYKEFSSCDIIVFASPIYFWTITGKLKTTVDRLYAELECLGYADFKKGSILLMTADSLDYSQATTWHKIGRASCRERVLR